MCCRCSPCLDTAKAAFKRCYVWLIGGISFTAFLCTENKQAAAICTLENLVILAVDSTEAAQCFFLRKIPVSGQRRRGRRHLRQQRLGLRRCHLPLQPQLPVRRVPRDLAGGYFGWSQNPSVCPGQQTGVRSALPLGDGTLDAYSSSCRCCSRDTGTTRQHILGWFTSLCSKSSMV